MVVRKRSIRKSGPRSMRTVKIVGSMLYSKSENRMWELHFLFAALKFFQIRALNHNFVKSSRNFSSFVFA